MKWILTMLLAGSMTLTTVAGDNTPPVTIVFGSRQGKVIPTRQGFAHTGGGNIDVAQPAPDTMVVTMSGVAVAGAHPCKESLASLQFDLLQELEIAVNDPKVRRASVTMDGRIIGLLRSHRGGGGAAFQGPGCATLIGGTSVVSDLNLPGQSVNCGNNMSLNCREGAPTVTILPGRYSLHQSIAFTASHPCSFLPCKAASAEFAPDPALDPLWISYWEPFHGANKKDFGFQVILKVAPAQNGDVR